MFFVGVIQVMVGEKLKTKFEIFGSGDPRRDGGPSEIISTSQPNSPLSTAYSI
jgi:hypothetical protein